MFCLALLLTGGPAFLHADEASIGAGAAWQRYQAPDFELFSGIDETASRRILLRVERLDAIVKEAFHLEERRPNPVTIYLFPDEASFAGHLPESLRERGRTQGYFLAGPDRSVIALSPRWDDDAQTRRLIFHEYVHHLSRVAGDHPPLWFSEGIAELFSTMEEVGDQLELGRPIEPHVRFLQERGLMPLEALFAIDASSPDYHEAERAGRFYAQSWALLHFWYCGSDNLPASFREGRDRFVDAMRADRDATDPAARARLFEACFQMNYEQAAAALENYVRRGIYVPRKIAIPPSVLKVAATSESLTANDVRRRLAELDLRVNGSAAARKLLLEASAETPPDLRVIEALGAAALKAGDRAAAERYWQDVVAAGTSNPAVYAQLATLEAQRWFSRLDVDFELPADAAVSLRQLLLELIRRAPQQTLGYETLAWVEATAKKPMVHNITLVQDHLASLQPRDRTLLALALGRIRMNDFVTARSLLTAVEREATVPQAIEWSATLRKVADDREKSAPAAR